MKVGGRNVPWSAYSLSSQATEHPSWKQHTIQGAFRPQGFAIASGNTIIQPGWVENQNSDYSEQFGGWHEHYRCQHLCCAWRRVWVVELIGPCQGCFAMSKNQVEEKNMEQDFLERLHILQSQMIHILAQQESLILSDQHILRSMFVGEECVFQNVQIQCSYCSQAQNKPHGRSQRSQNTKHDNSNHFHPLSYAPPSHVLFPMRSTW